MFFQTTAGGTESPDDHHIHQSFHGQGDSSMNSPFQDETLMIADEFLLRRIKNRERQRRYRERKRLEADVRGSHLAAHRLFYPAKTASNGTNEPRVRSGRKWKKEARRVYFLKEVESAMGERKIQGGRRDWKADARKRMEMDGGGCNQIVFDFSVLSE